MQISETRFKIRFVFDMRRKRLARRRTTVVKRCIVFSKEIEGAHVNAERPIRVDALFLELLYNSLINQTVVGPDVPAIVGGTQLQ